MLGSFLLLCSISITSRVLFYKLNAFLLAIALICYFVYLGPLKPFVPVLPFLGLFFKKHLFLLSDYLTKQFNIISCLNIFFINFLSWIGFWQRDLNLINLQSIFYLHMILVNILFSKRLIILPTLCAVLNAFFLNPGLLGNRSSLFLLFFILPNLIDFFKKQNFSIKKIIIYGFVFLFLVKAISDLIFHPKFLNEDYYEPRLDYLNEILLLIQEKGYINAIKKISDEFGVFNPHNSFAYLFIYEGPVGLYKSIIFLFSIFVIPVYIWTAIFLRASFDSFLLVGNFGIIYFYFINHFLCKKNSKKQ